MLILSQRQGGRRLDKETYLLLGSIRVGVNELAKDAHKIGVVKIMAKTCLMKPAPKPPKPSKKPQAALTAPPQPTPPKAKPRDVVTVPNG